MYLGSGILRNVKTYQRVTGKLTSTVGESVSLISMYCVRKESVAKQATDEEAICPINYAKEKLLGKDSI